MEKYQLLEKYLITFLKEEVTKTDLKSVIIGVSGGLDSAVTTLLLKKAFGKNLTAVMMPSDTSKSSSLSDAKKLCEKFDIDYLVEPIGKLVEAYFKDKNADSIRVGNFSARMRMSTLYDLSAKYNALVIGTSNKSEILLGYGTIFGDIACAINPIGDIYKSYLYGFASYLGVIDEILNKAPSADLWEGQSDEEELGYSYDIIDKVLIDFIDNGLSYEKLISKGHKKELVDMVTKRYYANQFKSRLPVIAKLNKDTFGQDLINP